MAKIKLFQALSQAIKRDAAVKGTFHVLEHGFEWIPQPNYSCDPLRYHINFFIQLFYTIVFVRCSFQQTFRIFVITFLINL